MDKNIKNVLLLTIVVMTMVVMPIIETRAQEVNLTDREIYNDAINKSIYKLPKGISIPQQAGGTEFTPASDADKKITFQKNSGDDLDQYLFRGSTPIDVYLDVEDLRPDPAITEKVKLTFRYWDVDRTGPSVSACEKGPEIDTVQFNGNMLPGELTGQSDEWNIRTYDINPSWIVKGQNHFQVNIDTTGTDCWAVLVDWVKLEIPFNIKVTKVETVSGTKLDIKDKNGVAIPNIIWEKKFDASGNLVDLTPNKVDYPFADWFNSKNFKFKVYLDAWPKRPPDFVPKVTHNYNNINKLGGAPDINSKDIDFDGWDDTYEVELPKQVGQREVVQKFNFKKSDGKLVQTDPEETKHKLYVTINDAVSVPAANPDPKPPKENWLDIATRWAAGTDKEDTALDAVFNKEYGAPPNEFGWEYPDSGIPWNQYKGIDGTSHGNCYIHRNALRAFAGMLGISTNENEYRDYFITGDKPALDNNKFAPAKNFTTKKFDRWIFGSHAQVIYKGQFWDVTFGRKYGAASDAAFANYVGTTSSGVDVFKKGAVTCGAVDRGPGAAAGKDGWTLYDYACSPAPPVYKATEKGNITHVSDSGLDTDGDTLYNFLAVKTKIYVNKAGIYGLKGNLIINNKPIIGSLEPVVKTENRKIYKNLSLGFNNVTLYFNGKQINELKTNGKYRINMTLLNRTGALVNNSSTLTKNSYLYTKFQGLNIKINSITDFGTDTNGDGQYEYLTVNINASRLGTKDVNLTVVGFIEKNKTIISSETTTQKISKLVNYGNIKLNFSGSDIRMGRQNGPYNLSLGISDDIYNTLVDKKTNSYSYKKFGKPGAEFNNIFSDSGQDTDFNSLYNFLDINVGINVSKAGNYTVSGWLANSAGNIITNSQNRIYLTTGQKTVTLKFNGKEIYKNKKNPYQLTVLELIGEAGTISIEEDKLNNIKLKNTYNYNQFENPEVTFTKKFFDKGIDTDSNNLYNILEIKSQANITKSGNYRIEAYLISNTSGKIISTLDYNIFLVPGITNISLNFSGVDIFSSKTNGPYKLSFVRATDISTGEIEDQLIDPYVTKIYNYNKFERAAIYIAGYSDQAIDTNSNGLYDYLRIKINITTNLSSNYAVNGRLVDAFGNEIVWDANHSSFVNNTPKTIFLDFPGFEIRANRKNGTFYLKDLSIHNEIGNLPQLFVTDAFATKKYNYTQFEKLTTIKGKVTNRSGSPIKGAVVFYTGDTDLTDSNGNYELAVGQSGTYNIKAVPPANMDLLTEEKNVNVVVGSDIILNFILYKPSSLSGQIKDKFGKPVSNAFITLSGPSYEYNYSDNNGNYIFPRIRNGTYNIKVTPPSGVNLLENTTSIIIPLESNIKKNLILEPGAIITGYIKASDGVNIIPLSNIYVYASGPVFKAGYSDETGKYEIISLVNGTYTLAVSAPYGIESNSSSITVVAGNTYKKNYTLKPTKGVISGIMSVNGLKLPLENTPVNVSSGTGYTYYYTNALGRLYVFGLENGTYNVSLEPSSYWNLTRNYSKVNVNITKIRIVNLDIKTIGAMLSGFVTDMAGNPIQYASIYTVGPVYGYGASNKYGRYMIFDQINGSYTATIYPPYGYVTNITTGINLTTGKIVLRNFKLKDSIPPAPVSELKNITYKRNYINWTYKDPSDLDLKHVTVYINGAWKANVTKGKQYYNSTGLVSNTLYKISTRTIDLSENIGPWVNKTARTAP